MLRIAIMIAKAFHIMQGEIGYFSDMFFDVFGRKRRLFLTGFGRKRRLFLTVFG